MDFIKKYFGYLKIFNTRGFWAGFAVGLFYFSYIFWWLWDLYPLEALGIQSHIVAGILIFLVFTLCVIITAVWWGLAGFFFIKLVRSDLTSPAVFAAIFTLAEYLRSIFFSIFWYGDGGLIGPYWPLGNLAYLTVNLDWVSATASLWGIYGLTFFIAWAGSSIFLALTSKNCLKIFAINIIPIILIFIVLNTRNVPKKINNKELGAVPIALIQTNTPAREFSGREQSLEDFRNKIRLLEKASKEIKEGIIVFPEGASFSRFLTQFLDTEGVKNYFSRLSEKELLIIDSLRTVRANSDFSSNSILISSKSGVVNLYEKQILVPNGEFLPYIIKLSLLIINRGFVDQFKIYRESARTGHTSDIFDYKNSRFKILVCSELIYPGKARSQNPDFIVLTGSYSIWNNSHLAASQILSAAQFRAIENNKYLVLAANSDRSYILNPQGNIEKMANPNTYELLTGEIVPNKNQTWYNYVGDWPIILLSAAVFGLGVKRKLT